MHECASVKRIYGCYDECKQTDIYSVFKKGKLYPCFMFDDSPSQICLVVLKNCRLTGPLATFQFERNASYGSSSFVMCAFLVFYSTMVVGAKDQSILTDFACLRRFHIIVSMPTCGYMC